MAETVKIVLKVDAKDVKKLKAFNKTLGKTSKESKGLGKSVKGLWIGYVALAGVLTGIVAAGIGKVILMASDLEEATTKFETVFRGIGDAAINMRDDLVDAFGMSRFEATEALSSIQDFLVPMGIARDKAADLSGQFVRMAVDLGSFNNLPTAQVMEDIKSGLAGMSLPMRKYGVDISETTLKQMALSEGLEITSGKLDRETRAMLILKKITQDSSDAMGDFAKTREGFANTMKIFTAVMSDVAADLGVIFLPAAKAVLKVLTSLGKQIKGVADAFRELKKEQEEHDTQVTVILKHLKEFNIETPKQIGYLRKLARAYDTWSFYKKQINKLGIKENNTLKELGKKLQQAKEQTTITGKEALRIWKLKEPLIIAELSAIKNTTTVVKKELDKQTEIKKTKAQEEMEVLNARYESELEGLLLFEESKQLLKDELTALGYASDVELLASQLGTKEAMELASLAKELRAKGQNDKAELLMEKAKTKALNEQGKMRAQNAKSWMSYMAGAQTSNIKALWAIGKASAAAQVGIDSYKAAMAGYSAMVGIPVVGPVLAVVAAAAAIAFGAEQIHKISATSPPAELGGIVPGSPGGTQLTVGEKNKAEAIIPLEDSSFAMGGITINVEGDVYGGDPEEIGEALIRKIDIGLFKLQQDRDSRFAESIAG